MRKTLLIALVTVCINANAQYFQHTYGTNNVWDVLCDGITPQAGTAGYFMTGVTNPLSLPGELIVSRTDVNGSLACGTCYYRRMPIILPGPIPKTLEVNQAKCVERTPANPLLTGVIAVVGGWVNNTAGTAGIFYTDFAPLGGLNAGPINISVPSYNLILGSIAKGPADVLYITGTAYAGGTRHVFVVKFNMATYTVIWGNVYNILPASGRNNEDAYDIVEDLNNPGTIYVVGRIEDNNGTPGSNDGFVLPINANTGVAGTVNTYGTTTKPEYLNSIRPSAAVPIGYVIGGTCEDPATGRTDMWAMKIDNTNAIVWNTRREYNNGMPLGKNERNSDVMERLNILSNYEYYQVGTTDGSIYGGYDMIVYKLDATGNGVATGQFTYGGGVTDDAVTLDFANPATDGLALFGTYDYTGTGIKEKEFYLVRSYFNGVTGCNYDRRNLSTDQTGPGYLTTLNVTKFGTFSTSNFQSANPAIQDNDDEICWAQSVAIGSNARIAPAKTGDETGVVISPNPMAQNGKEVMLTLEVPAEEQATVAIYDMLGKQYYNSNFTLGKGSNTLPLDLSATGMAPGMYSVRISGEQTNKTIVLMVK